MMFNRFNCIEINNYKKKQKYYKYFFFSKKLNKPSQFQKVISPLLTDILKN